MNRLVTWFVKIAAGERGQDMVEYALVTAMISVAVVVATLVAGIPVAFNVWATDLGSCVADWTTC